MKRVMKRYGDFAVKALVSGFLIVLPLYLAVLLMLKGMKALAGLGRPLATLHPPGWPVAAGVALAVFIVVTICFVLGVAALSRRGRAVLERIEIAVLVKIPVYTLVRDLTQQLAGRGRGHAWKPALAQMAGGLVLAFIIEDAGDGRYTVFIPSVPSPFRGSVYILHRERVHPLNASFAQTVQVLSRWGSGARHLLAALESQQPRERAS